MVKLENSASNLDLLCIFFINNQIAKLNGLTITYCIYLGWGEAIIT